MAAEGGKNWNKEVGTIDNSAAAEQKRTEFYTERVNKKLGDTFDNIVADVAGKGYKTLDELKDKNYEQEIKSGDTLFVTLRQYFNEVLGGGAQAGADNEAYLSLAILMKDYPGVGVNVDNLQVGGKIEIKDGYLTVKDAAGKVTIDNKPLRRPGGAKVEEPAVVLPPVSVPGPVELPPATSKTEEPAAAPSTEPTVPTEAPTDKVVPLPSDSTSTPPVAPAASTEASKPAVEQTPESPEQKILTSDQINGSEIVSGKYVWPGGEGGGVSEGRFRGGYQIDGKYISPNGSFIQEGTFWESGINALKFGKVVSPSDGGWISLGSFNEEGYIIDGVINYNDGRIEYIFSEAKLSEYEALAKGKTPGKEFRSFPYRTDGNKVVFKEEGRIWGVNDLDIVTVENAEKANQLAIKLNERFQPVIKEKAAANAEKKAETPAPVNPPAGTEQPTPPAPVETPPAAPAAPSTAQSAPVAGPETPTE